MSLKLENTGGGVYRLHLNDEAAVGIKVPDENAADELIRGLRDQFGGATYGDVWAIATVLVRVGASVPSWRNYYEQIQRAYRGWTPDRVFFRERIFASADERRRAMWEHVEAGQRVYVLRYVPEEVQLPQFFEGGMFADFCSFRKAALQGGVDHRWLMQFVFKSFWSDRVWMTQPDFDPECIKCLRQIGFIVDQDQFTAEEWLSHISMAHSRAVLKAAGLNSSRTLGENLAALRSAEAQNPGLIADSMSMIAGPLRLSAYRAPNNWGWDDYQSIRQQLKGMATMLVDIYDGGVSRANRGDFTLLTARVSK